MYGAILNLHKPKYRWFVCVARCFPWFLYRRGIPKDWAWNINICACQDPKPSNNKDITNQLTKQQKTPTVLYSVILFEIHPYSLGLWTEMSRGSLGFFYSGNFLHQTLFTQDLFYTENFTCLYTKNVYTDFFATNPLHQKANTPPQKKQNFSDQKRLHPKPFTPQTRFTQGFSQ